MSCFQTAFSALFFNGLWVIVFLYLGRNFQENVGPKAQGAAEGFRETGEATEGNEGFRKINQTGGK